LSGRERASLIALSDIDTFNKARRRKYAFCRHMRKDRRKFPVRVTQKRKGITRDEGCATHKCCATSVFIQVVDYKKKKKRRKLRVPWLYREEARKDYSSNRQFSCRSNKRGNFTSNNLLWFHKIATRHVCLRTVRLRQKSLLFFRQKSETVVTNERSWPNFSKVGDQVSPGIQICNVR